MEKPTHVNHHAGSRDYDRDRYGYDHPAGSPRRHGHSRFADPDRDAWEGPSPTYDPRPSDAPTSPAVRDPSVRTDEPDDRDGWQRLGSDASPPSDHALGEDASDGGTQGDAPTKTVRSQVAYGSKSLVHSDERLLAELCERLASLEYDWSTVEVCVTHGVATLTGTVSTLEPQYEAERVADSVRGIHAVTNRISVRYTITGAG